MSRRVGRTRALARVGSSISPELRAERDRVSRALDGFPGPRARALEGLAAERERLSRARDLAERTAQVARSELDALGPLKRRGDHGREVRGQLERADRQLERVGRIAGNVEQKITDVRADHDPVAWMDEHAEQIRDLRAIDDELSVRARRTERQLVRAAQSDPPEHITAVLGHGPEHHAARLQWERGVWAIETYRHREGIPASHEASALGREPARGQDRQRYSETVATVRQARAELGLEPQRGELPEAPTFPDRLAERALERGPERDRDIDLDYER